MSDASNKKMSDIPDRPPVGKPKPFRPAIPPGPLPEAVVIRQHEKWLAATKAAAWIVRVLAKERSWTGEQAAKELVKVRGILLKED